MPSATQLIKENKFDYVNSNITEDLFPVPASISTDYKLFHFEKFISSEDAIEEMKKEGYSPANIYELLEWKDWNGKDVVVALGSVSGVSGGRYVPFLSRRDSKRDLDLRWFVSVWRARCRFLGVRNSSLENLDALKSSLESLDTLTLESAIKICKENGLEVYKQY